MGTGGALRKALPLLSDVFMVIYGDSYLQTDFRQVYSAFLTSNADALMTVFENDDRFDRSNAEFANGRVLRYTKGSRTPDMKYIDYGLGVFRRETLLRVPPERPFDLAELYESLAESGRLAGIEVRDRFFEIGSPQGLAETEAFIETTSSVASLVSAT
jgi:NDP-sugar pyrophosphorylase family protein